MFPERIAELVTAAPWDLGTTRLDLLSMRPEHAPGLFAVLSEPALYTFTGGAPPVSVEALALRLTRLAELRAPDGEELWLNWTLRLRGTCDVLGYVQATLTEDRADLAWVLGLPFQGRGYGSEAAGAMMSWLYDLGMGRFRACIKPDHHASQRVAERLGMWRTEEWIDGEEVWQVTRG